MATESEILGAARALPVEQRVELVTTIWDEVPVSALVVTPAPESLREILEAVRKLPREERIELAMDLWDDIPEADLCAMPVPDWQKEILRERMAAHEANPEDAIPWQDVLRRLGERLG